MPYRERVIESLESHVNESCAKCKYRESDAQFCLKELLKDAIELLKGEAR